MVPHLGVGKALVYENQHPNQVTGAIFALMAIADATVWHLRRVNASKIIIVSDEHTSLGHGECQLFLIVTTEQICLLGRGDINSVAS